MIWVQQRKADAGIIRKMRSLFVFLTASLALATLSAQTPPLVKKTAAPAAKASESGVAAKNFKESGSPTAPIQIEIYTDYECPACRELYMNTLPLLIKDYVQTGKVRLVHRDFPLSQHQYSPLATKYANAAGEIGKYDVVAGQIFKTQPESEQNGNVDAAVARVLSPAEMQKVRDIVKSSPPGFDNAVKADMAMGEKDRLQQTPTMVLIFRGGKREVIAPVPPYTILKSYLDQRLAK
jgi:protein-disulfide isomerase